jgi:uncharacterized protein (TIGR03435 family)
LIKALAGAALMVISAFGQSETAPKFEIASIKPSPESAGWQYSIKPSPGGFRATNIPLSYLITWAFQINDYQLIGGPAWMTNRYDIAAQPAAPNSADWQLMVQGLLEERFHLKVHRETRERTEYALIVAKGGSKLKVPKEAACSAESDPEAGPCGRLSWNNTHLAGRRAPMKTLVFVLAQALRHTVVDETGLKGPFDMTLSWTPDAGIAQAPPDAPPPLLVAVEEQMGLKLQARKGQTGVIVVDHLEKPTEN